MSDCVDTLDDGTSVEVEWRVMMFGNRVQQPYYLIEIPMFVHTFEDGERVLLVDEEYFGEDDRVDYERPDYARAYADGVPLDPEHPHIESIEVVDDV